MVLGFTGERIVPGAADCEPTFAQKMYQEHLARYAFAAQFAKGAEVLDVGCGVGYGSQWLGKAGAKSVLGFDLSEAAIEHARMHYFHAAVSFKVQDATTIEAGNGYDLVTCFELIEHIAQQEHVLDLIKGALRERGVLAISTPRPLDEIRTHFHVHEMTFEELHRMLKRRFKYVEPYFEVNCFTSLVGKQLPDQIEQIVPVSSRIEMANADYFIFLASDTPITDKIDPQPLLTLNDDSYVLTLERDVGILRRAENDHIARIADLEREKGQLAVAHAAAVERGAAIASIQQEASATREAIGRLESQITQQTLREQAELSRLTAAKAEVDRQNEVLAREVAASGAELDSVRRIVADLSARLASAETDAFNLRSEAERLPQALERVSTLENELNALRYRLDQSEATLTRFRKSLSWSLTRPVRWIGRTFKKMMGRSNP